MELNWRISMIYRMATYAQRNSENLPTYRGLVSFLDMRNASSYSGLGTTITDLSGNSNGGTINGTSTIGGDSSLVLDGSSTYISTAISSALFSGNEASISIYIKLDVATNTNGFKTGFIGYNNNSATRSHYPYTNGLMYADTFRTARVEAFSPSASVTRTNYHQVTITTKGGGDWKMYQDNFLIKTVSAESTISILKQSIGLSTPNIYLDGSFLSSVIYNVELTASEVADNLTYNQTI